MASIYTIEYGGRPPDEFINLLLRNQVKTVVDVRLRPDRASMAVYAKGKTADKGIQKLLAESGIGYMSLIELGNIFIDLEDWRERYRQLLKSAGDLLIERLASVPMPFCLLCAEKRASECHRGEIAGYLARKGHEIIHLE